LSLGVSGFGSLYFSFFFFLSLKFFSFYSGGSELSECRETTKCL